MGGGPEGLGAFCFLGAEAGVTVTLLTGLDSGLNLMGDIDLAPLPLSSS